MENMCLTLIDKMWLLYCAMFSFVDPAVPGGLE